MTADACNRQVIAGPVEATAIGNVMMQAVGMGQLSSILEARSFLRSSSDIRVYDPHPSDAWEEAMRAEFLM